MGVYISNVWNGKGSQIMIHQFKSWVSCCHPIGNVLMVSIEYYLDSVHFSSQLFLLEPWPCPGLFIAKCSQNHAQCNINILILSMARYKEGTLQDKCLPFDNLELPSSPHNPSFPCQFLHNLKCNLGLHFGQNLERCWCENLLFCWILNNNPGDVTYEQLGVC